MRTVIKITLLILIITLSFLGGYIYRNDTIPANKNSQNKPKNILLPETINGTYRVINVIDGDTIELETNEKLRYIGIDAPETNSRWGPEAKELNEKLILNKKVKVEFDRVKLDKYGRLLAYVWIDNMMINEEQLKHGYAKVNLMKHESKLKYIDRLQKAEQSAKEDHNGLWLDEWIIK